MFQCVMIQIPDSGDHIVSKIYNMTRVEGENTRLRHYLARLHRKTLCYACVSRNAEEFYLIITSLFKVPFYSYICLIHTAISNASNRLG